MLTAPRAVFLTVAFCTLATLDVRASRPDTAGAPIECSVTAIQARAPRGTTITAAAVVAASGKDELPIDRFRLSLAHQRRSLQPFAPLSMLTGFFGC